jgi:hypothetical protein
MINKFKSGIKATSLYDIIRASLVWDVIKYIRDWKGIRDWERSGKKNMVPQGLKVKLIKECAKKFSIQTLIETGTFLGETVWTTRRSFKQIISIELDDDLYRQAKKRFSGFNHIRIIHGDSGEELGKVLANINQPCLFWLDGHYSAGITAKGKEDTPIIREISHILNHHIQDHVILIDDAHDFTGDNDYPTLEELRIYIFSNSGEMFFEVTDDIIRIHKKLMKPGS